MELAEAVARRRMVRSFRSDPVDEESLDRILAAGLRAPSAGNTRGTELVVLSGPQQTALYWDVALPPQRRSEFPWPGLLRAPVLVLPVSGPGPYVERYAEPDKAGTGLGEGADRWTVPYWDVDAGFVAMTILLAVADEGLGALFFGLFDRQPVLVEALGIPTDRRPIGVVAIGHPDGGDRPSRSLSRPVPTWQERVHRGSW